MAGGEEVEIIVIDDGSTDRTGAIADCYAEKYPETVRAVHQKNGLLTDPSGSRRFICIEVTGTSEKRWSRSRSEQRTVSGSRRIFQSGGFG